MQENKTANQSGTYIALNSEKPLVARYMTSQEPAHKGASEWVEAVEGESHKKVDEQIRRGDESKQEWSIRKDNTPLADLPLIRLAGDCLGMTTKNSVLGSAEDLADIVDLTVGILGKDDPDTIYKFLRHQMRMAQSGSYGHTIRSLTLHLKELAQEFS